jgi:hypothetical protein
MKNKKLTYVLGLAVLVVWGLIIYRVVEAAGGDDDAIPATSTIIKKEVYNDYSIPKDTTRLLLNYRDPFGLIKQKDTVKQKSSSSKRSFNSLAIKPAFNWGFIKYSGYMRNPGSKKLVALLVINGKNVNMAEGETVDNVKLIRNMGDSVKVSYSGKTKFIDLHQ